MFEKYKVAIKVNNKIQVDESKSFKFLGQAIREARNLYEKTGSNVAIFGYRTYEPNDKVSAHERNYFWQEWSIENGKSKFSRD